MVIWSALSWWSAPRESDVAQARAALAGGHVVSYEWGTSWDTGSGWLWDSATQLDSSGDGSIFAWRTTDWRIHYTRTDRAAPDQAVRDAGSVEPTVGFRGVPTITAVASALFGLSVLVLLITGSAPITGTRWFWFWLLVVVPFGLGASYWLVGERPWSPRASWPTGPPGTDNRRRGWNGFALSILAAILISLAAWGLHSLRGDRIVPDTGI